ncbi:unnamed protein product, partial [Iphiclides podalirius]
MTKGDRENGLKKHAYAIRRLWVKAERSLSLDVTSVCRFYQCSWHQQRQEARNPFRTWSSPSCTGFISPGTAKKHNRAFLAKGNTRAKVEVARANAHARIAKVMFLWTSDGRK